MALSFTNATGNLFNRLGSIFGAIKANQTFQATTLPTVKSSVSAQFATRQDMLPTFQTTLSQAQSVGQSFTQAMSTLATNTLLTMVQEDSPQPAKTLAYAIPELIRQMNTAGATVVKNTVGSSLSTSTSNTGNGTVLISTTDEAGNDLENLIAESFSINCTADSQPGQGTTAGQERFSAIGDLSTTSLDFNWPLGSGSKASLTASSADVGPNAANLLTNSNFETWSTAGSLTAWSAITGTFGTTINQTAGSYRGSYALAITSTGSQLTQVTQTLRTAGTVGLVQPQTKYALAFRSKVSAVPSNGVLRVALKDTVNGTIYGGSTVTLSSETTSYALHSTTFNTPLVLPTTLTAVVELTTALDNGKSVMIDDLLLSTMNQMGNGPFLTVIPGNVNFIRGDTFTVTLTNDRGGQFQEYFNRCFNMAGNGWLLPSAASVSATISNSLIA